MECGQPGHTPPSGQTPSQPTRAPSHTTPTVSQTSHDSGASPDSRRSLGSHGEELALAHLSALGYRLVERNHRTRLGEIDLIVCDGRRLLFVEVKTRRTRVVAGFTRSPASLADVSAAEQAAAAGASASAEPEPRNRAQESYEGLIELSLPRARQRQRTRRVAAQWLAQSRNRPSARELRFDVIGVVLDPAGGLLRLDHLEGAF